MIRVFARNDCERVEECGLKTDCEGCDHEVEEHTGDALVKS